MQPQQRFIDLSVAQASTGLRKEESRSRDLLSLGNRLHKIFDQCVITILRMVLPCTRPDAD